jgi:Icc-related predicted phosphoesterase
MNVTRETIIKKLNEYAANLQPSIDNAKEFWPEEAYRDLEEMKEALNQAAMMLKEKVQVIEACKFAWYGSVDYFPPDTSREEIERRVRDEAVEQLVKSKNLKIIIKMEPVMMEQEDGTIEPRVSGGWRILLPEMKKEEESS